MPNRVLVTAASTTPVSLTDAKSHLRVDFSADDAYITSLIEAATEWVQIRTGRQLVTATWKQQWDSFPSVWAPAQIVTETLGTRLVYQGMTQPALSLDLAPVSSVSWLKYYDIDNTLQTVSSSDYWLDANSLPPRIVPAVSWPSVYLGRPNVVQAQFVAGYGSASAVPGPLKLAILWLVAHWYENREAILVSGYAREVPFGVENICMQYEAQLIR